MNSSPVVISYLTRFYREHRCLQILSNTVALNSYLGLSALSKKKKNSEKPRYEFSATVLLRIFKQRVSQ